MFATVAVAFYDCFKHRLSPCPTSPSSFCRAMGHRLNFIDITRTCHSRSSQTGNAMPPYDVTPIQPPPPSRCLPLWHAINFYERTTLFINSQTALPQVDQLLCTVAFPPPLPPILATALIQLRVIINQS